MPSIMGQTSIAASSINNNVLAGSAYEYLPFHSYVEFGLVDDASSFLRVTVRAGSDTLMEEAQVSPAARVPIYPDDFLVTDNVMAGQRLIVAARNTDAAAHTLRWVLKLTPI